MQVLAVLLLAVLALCEGFSLRTRGSTSHALKMSADVDARKGSGGRAVTWAQRHDWCDAVERCRLGEFDVQVAAIRRGMDSVVPLRVLQIFT